MKRGAPNHPKMHELVSRLNLARWGGVGILESLWHFAGQYARRGDIGRHTDRAIARALGWEGDAAELVEALVASGWVDRCPCHRLRVHDWPDHADQAVSRSPEVKALGWIGCYTAPAAKTSLELDADEKAPAFSILPLPLPLPSARARANDPPPQPSPPPAARSAVRPDRQRRQEGRAGADELARYRDLLACDRGLRPTTAAQKAEWRRALESGRYTAQQLRGSISEAVWSELVTAGRLARDAPWPPVGLAPYDARGSPAEASGSEIEDLGDELVGGGR